MSFPALLRLLFTDGYFGLVLFRSVAGEHDLGKEGEGGREWSVIWLVGVMWTFRVLDLVLGVVALATLDVALIERLVGLFTRCTVCFVTFLV